MTTGDVAAQNFAAFTTTALEGGRNRCIETAVEIKGRCPMEEAMNGAVPALIGFLA